MSGRRTVRLVRAGFPDRGPALDTAVSHALLRRVATGDEPETLRLHRPGPVVAFGPLDRLSPGFGRAVHAARDRGFGSVLRLAGGRAAVFHEGTIGFAWITPDQAPRSGIARRFDELARIVVEGLRTLGIDARVGEVPGEYCPGHHSVNARGRTKLMGVGQRLVAGAAHVGGVLVVSGSARIRDVLLPVNEALGVDWDPETVGSLEDEAPGLGWEAAEAALEGAFAARFDLIEGGIAEATLAAARRLERQHFPAL